MASFTNAQAIFGLSAESEATGTRTTGSVVVGLPQTAIRFSEAGIKAWSFRAMFSKFVTSQKVTFKFDGSSVVPDTAFVAGAAQAEYIDGTGTVSTAGNATITVTSSGMSGSPKAVSFAVALSDTPAMWIAKAKSALEADAAISERFTVSISGGSSNRLTLTRKPEHSNTLANPTLEYYFANDSTMNIAVANDTCAGITAVTTSTTSVAGIETSGIKLVDADGKDWEGNTLGASSMVIGFLVEVNSGDCLFYNDGGVSSYTETSGKSLFCGGEGSALSSTYYPSDGLNYIEQQESDFSDVMITILCA